MEEIEHAPGKRTAPTVGLRGLTMKHVLAIRQAARFLEDQQGGRISTVWPDDANPWRELAPKLREAAEILAPLFDHIVEAQCWGIASDGAGTTEFTFVTGDEERFTIHGVPHEWKTGDKVQLKLRAGTVVGVSTRGFPS